MIIRARRDGREARGNEERKKREDQEREQRGDRAKRQFEEKEGLTDPPLLEFLDPTLRCSHCFFKSSGYEKLELKHQNLFLQAIENIILITWHGVKQNEKKCAIGETECKVFILGGQRIDQKRKNGWGEGEERGLRKGAVRG